MASSINPISVTFAAGSEPFVTAILRLAVASGRFTSPHAIVSMISLPSATAVVEIEVSRLRAGEEASAPAGDPGVAVIPENIKPLEPVWQFDYHGRNRIVDYT